ncbi:MAG: lasso peptide biosynthesis B2 protein [Acidobacteria bacterium]|nr:MAG: lasso peptide biosynthesis B2 protein [Acidobacteriota bacterium]
MTKVLKFWRLQPDDRWLVLEAAVLLGFARLGVIVLPFRFLAAALGTQAADLERCETTTPAPQIARVGWAVRRISCHTPWQSNCLTKAVAGRIMLRRRRIASTVYFGLTKTRDGALQAHAWLSTGNSSMTGGSNLNRYTVVAKFID